MSTPFIAEIKIISFNFAPKGWAFCNGQLLPINQNQALFSILGTTYGGDGRVNFGLPDLRGRIPIHFGPQFQLGVKGGEEATTLTIQQMPAHNHLVSASSAAANRSQAQGNVWAAGSANAYAPSSDAAMNPASITNIGGSQPHNNLPPYLVLNFVIALQGIFPSQN